MNKVFKEIGIILVLLCATLPVHAQLINLQDPLSGLTFSELVTNLTTFIMGFIGSLAVLAFVWGAIIYLTSRGDPSQVQKAHKIVVYAAIGLAIALLGTAIINIVKYIITGE